MLRRRISRAPFARLVAHFAARLTGSEGATGENQIGSGALLGLLAAPGACLCFLLLDNYSTLMMWSGGRVHVDLYVMSVPDKFLFISVAMAITGIVTVLKWDRILPDAQDYLNLAPLPVRPHAILLANVVAIACVVLIISVDVNAIPGTLFPLVVSNAMEASCGALFHFIAVHTLCVILASVFTFCTVFAVFGLAAAVLPRNAFSAISSALRGAALIAFLLLLLSGFAGLRILHRLADNPASPLRWLPSLWFLGLYQTLQHRPMRWAPALARLAWQGVLAAFGVMVVAYAASYRRRFASSLEGGRRPSQRYGRRALLAVLDLFAPRAVGFGRAAFRFVTRALLQHEGHRMCLAVALGLGWLLAIQSITGAGANSGALPAIGVLQAPLQAAYLLVLGLRLALEMPVSLPANWIFRFVLDPQENETAGIARRVMYSFLTLFVMAPCLVFSLVRMSPATALMHTLYVLALAAFLVELSLANYRKMPLACPSPGFRHNLLLLCLLQIFCFAVFTRLGAVSERWMFDAPLRFALVPFVLGSVWLLHRRRVRDEFRDGERERGMVFDNPLDPALERLKLFED